MKKITSISVIFLFLFPAVVFSQVIKKVSTEPVAALKASDLFTKGTSIVDLLPNVSFQSMNSKSLRGVPNAQTIETTTNNLAVNYRANYYVADHFAVVAGVHVNNSTTKQAGLDDQKRNLFLGEIGAQYGQYLGKIPVRAEFTVGLGNYKVNDDNAFTFEYNLNVATFFNLENSGTYISPQIGIAGYKNNFDDLDFENKTFGLVAGVSLVRPMGCGDYSCGFGGNEAGDFYGAGTNLLQFTQNGVLGFGNNRRIGSSSESKDGLFGYALRFDGYHYFLPNFAGGFGIEAAGLTTNDKENEYNTSESNWSFTPKIRFNTPVSGALNHLFVEGGVSFGFGNNSTENTYMGVTSETVKKSKIFGWKAGVGYNYPVSEHFGIVGIAEFMGDMNNQSYTSDFLDFDTDIDRIGTQFKIGLSYTF